MLLSKLYAGECRHSEDSHMPPNAAVLSLSCAFKVCAREKRGQKKESPQTKPGEFCLRA